MSGRPMDQFDGRQDWRSSSEVHRSFEYVESLSLPGEVVKQQQHRPDSSLSHAQLFPGRSACPKNACWGCKMRATIVWIEYEIEMRWANLVECRDTGCPRRQYTKRE